MELQQEGEVIHGLNNSGWLYYQANISSQLENWLNTHYSSDGILLKNVIRYIVLCKGIPLKIDANADGNIPRKNIAVDGLVCLLFQNVLSLYNVSPGNQPNPYRFVDQTATLDYRFLPNHFAESGWTLSYLATRIDGENLGDVLSLIQRSANANYSGNDWWVLDADNCSVYGYMGETHAALKQRGYVHLNPDPFVSNSQWITTNPGGNVIGYVSHGNHSVPLQLKMDS